MLLLLASYCARTMGDREHRSSTCVGLGIDFKGKDRVSILRHSSGLKTDSRAKGAVYTIRVAENDRE